MAITGGLLATGCASRVKMEVPAAPTVRTEARSIAVVADNRMCREIADALAEQLRGANLDVRPDADARLTVFACNQSWLTEDASLEGRAQAVASLRANGFVQAQLLGVASHGQPADEVEQEGTIRYKRRVQRSLQQRVARDLAEQVAPVPLPVRRRVYTNSPVGSARSYHNLAVTAEREGRLLDALWWAERAHEIQPSKLRARYVEELSRRVSRTGAAPL